MRITLFRVEEANALLPGLKPQLEKLRAQNRELDRMESRMGVLALATAGADEANTDAVELRAFAGKRQRLGRLIARELATLHDAGVMVKDLDTGLVDFYSLKGDRLVFLCWRLGEPEVAHWHGLDDGFAGRHPLKSAERE